MNLLEAVQPYLYSTRDTIDIVDDRTRYRLTMEDKKAIEMAALKNGYWALQNVTKGGAMLYLKAAMRFSGEDEQYLRSIFAPETASWPGYSGVHKCAPHQDLPCPASGWPIKEQKIAIPFSQSAESVALSLLSVDGWAGWHSEGNTIRCIFRAILLPYLIEKNPYIRVDPKWTPLCHAIHFLVPMTAIGIQGLHANQKDVPRKAIDEMHEFIDWRLNQPVLKIQSDYEVVAAAHGMVWPKTPSSELDILGFLAAIPAKFWHDLLEIYARYDGTLSHGWPDLELTNGKQVMLVEVKVKDRLTPHQKNTIPILMGMGMDCRVIRLIKTADKEVNL